MFKFTKKLYLDDLVNLMLGGVTASFKMHQMNNLKTINKKQGKFNPENNVKSYEIENKYMLRLK